MSDSFFFSFLLLFGLIIRCTLTHATKFILEIDQGLKEKESSSPHKHLDNCLLQHEKQLEVSGSWEEEVEEEEGGRVPWVSGLCRVWEGREREREGTERGEEGGKLHCEVTATEAARPEHRSKREEEEEGSWGAREETRLWDFQGIVWVIKKKEKKITIQWFFQKSAVRGNKSKAAACNKDSWKCQISPLYFTLLQCGKGAQTCRRTDRCRTPTHTLSHTTTHTFVNNVRQSSLLKACSDLVESVFGSEGKKRLYYW